MSTVIVENARQIGKYEALRLENTQLHKRIAAYEGAPSEGIINIVAKSISDCMHKYWNDRMLTYWKEEPYADSLMGEKWHANAAITAFQKAVRDTLSEGK